jgi:hypothetical protein
VWLESRVWDELDVKVGDCKGAGGSGAYGMPESVYPLLAMVEYDW